MKKTLSRICSLLLCAVLCLCVLPPASAAGEVAVNSTNFPDTAFRGYVSANFDTDGSGTLSSDEIGAVTDLYADELGITTLKGVEFFSALENLTCSFNRLTALDVSKNTALRYLCCSYNQLTAVNTSFNRALGCLDCTGNQITKLDMTNNTALQQLYCDSNALTALDISRCPELYDLQAYGNRIAALDIRNNPRLIHAYRLGETYTDADWIEYSMSQGAGDIPVIFTLSVDPSTAIQAGSAMPPAVSAQPKAVTVAAGKTAKFIVKVTGEGLSYQWYVVKEVYGSTIKLSGKTSPTLSFTAKKSQNGYRYLCVVSNQGGEVYSDAKKLTVVTAPKITSQPVGKTVKAGSKVTFKVKASGGGLSYRWYYQKPGTTKWVKISSAAKASYTFTAKKARNGYKFRCLISNKAGKAYSKAVKLTVK